MTFSSSIHTMKLLVFVLFTTSSILVQAELRGLIESCSGWALNKLPELKSFLKDGEAETYKGISIEYVPGRSATLTIYENEIEKERILLSSYKKKKDMHALMVEKGFERKSEEEIKRDEEKRMLEKKEQEKNQRKEQQHLRGNIKVPSTLKMVSGGGGGRGRWEDVNQIMEKRMTRVKEKTKQQKQDGTITNADRMEALRKKQLYQN